MIVPPKPELSHATGHGIKPDSEMVVRVGFVDRKLPIIDGYSAVRIDNSVCPEAEHILDGLQRWLDKTVEGVKKKAQSWAACLARVFEVFPLICPRCRKELLPVAVIFNDYELIRILSHFGLPTDFPKFIPVPKEIAGKYSNQATGPPDDGCQLVPAADLPACR